MAAPNIVNTTAIYGETEALTLTTSNQTICGNLASSGKVIKVNTLMISNRDTAQSLRVDAFFQRGSQSYAIVKGIPVPPDASLIAISKDNPVYLQEGDSITVAAEESATDNCQAICSYEVIS